MTAQGIFVGGCSPGYLGPEVPSGIQGQGPGKGSGSRQKLKQFADIVYRFRLQKLSKFENMRLNGTLILDEYVSRWGLSNILRLPFQTSPLTISIL